MGDGINFEYVIKNIMNIDDESIKAGILCELAKGVVNSKYDEKTILERLDTILDIADSLNDDRYKSVVIGQIALVCAKYLNMPCDSEMYAEMIDGISAEKKFIERITKLKKEV
jgi:hypothetical protein